MFRDQRIALRQGLGHRPDRQAGTKAGQIGKLGHKRAIDKHQLAAVDIGKQRAGILGPRLRGSIRRDRKRLGVAHQRAQIGVFPFLDAAMRQAGCGETLERSRAQRRGAGQLALRRQPLGRELLLGGILHQGQFSHFLCLLYSAATASWYCA
jgi:hypothetical protein